MSETNIIDLDLDVNQDKLDESAFNKQFTDCLKKEVCKKYLQEKIDSISKSFDTFDRDIDFVSAWIEHPDCSGRLNINRHFTFSTV
jgi:hypothetical protein